jgi:hypothetical protein
VTVETTSASSGVTVPAAFNRPTPIQSSVITPAVSIVSDPPPSFVSVPNDPRLNDGLTDEELLSVFERDGEEVYRVPVRGEAGVYLEGKSIMSRSSLVVIVW